MKAKRFTLLVLLFAFCCMGTSWAEQEGQFAFNNSGIHEIDPSEQVSLKKTLKGLESAYNVVFFYRTDLIEGKSHPKVELRGSLTDKLETLLTPYRLSSKHLGEQVYVISKKEAFSQAVADTVRGRVTDIENGETLPGVNILIKGTS
ncbi:MAG TPA: hypothetical protein VJ878_03590, partial [Candidatus Izemoplasmatales bacterium]|nr:hypothetical protein [Candidatus Izemoplasmatales bacterium]